MCRDHRRCRSSWDEASKLRENARRRVSRNSAKRAAAEAAGEDARATEYAKLVSRAEEDLRHADGMRAASSAEHEAPMDGEHAQGVDIETGEDRATETEVIDQPRDDEAPTEPLDMQDDGWTPPTEPLDEAEGAPRDPREDTDPDDTAPPKKPRRRKTRESDGGGESKRAPANKERPAKEERPLTYRYIDPLDDTPLGQIIKFYRGDYASERTRNALDEHGIPYRVDDDGLAISADAWNPATFDVLDGLGFTSLPPRDAAPSGFEWVLPGSADAA